MANLLVPIILLISSVGLFFTYLSPGYETLQAFQTQQERIKAALVTIDTVKEKKEELASQYRNFDQVGLDNLKLMLPTKTDVAQTIIILDKIAQDNFLYVDEFGIPQSGGVVSLRRGVEEEAKDYGPSSFRIVVSGSYEGIKNLLYQIERSALLMDVTECMIEVDDSTEGAIKYRATISLNTYRLF